MNKVDKDALVVLGVKGRAKHDKLIDRFSDIHPEYEEFGWSFSVKGSLRGKPIRARQVRVSHIGCVRKRVSLKKR